MYRKYKKKTLAILDLYNLEPKEVAIWSAITPVALLFAFLLGRWLAPLTAFLSGSKLYSPANYQYSESTRFDNTILTYGTDYILAALMGSLGVAIANVKSTHNLNLKYLASALLISYSLSTFTGALCHHFLSTPARMNALLFRTLWRLCVGLVGIGGGIIGAIGTELLDIFNREKGIKSLFPVPRIPHGFWFCWSAYFFFIICIGSYSMRQPACDIFLTGVTQAIPTVYLVSVLVSKKSLKKLGISNSMRNLLLFGALGNIPLLPLYDLFNFLKFSLGLSNTLLHSTLGVAWGSQGLALLRILNKLKKE